MQHVSVMVYHEVSLAPGPSRLAVIGRDRRPGVEFDRLCDEYSGDVWREGLLTEL